MATANPAPAQKAVFCHYLPWYTLKATATDSQARHGWCGVGTAIPAAQCTDSSHTQYMGMGPFIGEYSQRETNVLEYHLLLAHAASIDAFIVNINPSNALQVELTKALFVATSALQQQFSTSFNLRAMDVLNRRRIKHMIIRIRHSLHLHMHLCISMCSRRASTTLVLSSP